METLRVDTMQVASQETEKLPPINLSDPSCKIMIVDDSDHTQETLQNRLIALGAMPKQIQSTAASEIAMDAVIRYKPQLIFLDGILKGLFTPGKGNQQGTLWVTDSGAKVLDTISRYAPNTRIVLLASVQTVRDDRVNVGKTIRESLKGSDLHWADLPKSMSHWYDKPLEDTLKTLGVAIHPQHESARE